jgi:transcriptional regulator with XRE-family HTH domain
MVNNSLPTLGQHLRTARKKLYPKDDLQAFALRIGVSRATLQKMEQGDLSVSMSRYFSAAELLGLEEGFNQLFIMEESLFDD